MNYTTELLKQPFVIDARGALPRNPTKAWRKRDPSKIVGVCYHQALEATGSAMGTAKYDCGPNHLSADGCSGLSYTGFIEKDGRLWLAWDIEDKTWSQGDANIPGDENEEYVAFCFGGDFSGPGYLGSQAPTGAQMNTAKALWEFWGKVVGWSPRRLFGHYHFGKPACPGFALMNLIETIRVVPDGTVPYAKCDLTVATGRQEALARLGYYTGPIDGVWSCLCRYGLTQFQRAAGISADGVWGPFTEAAIVKALG